MQVSVVTSDVPDGAFDGNVYITLNGTEGSSEEVGGHQRPGGTRVRQSTTMQFAYFA
jgi:hypothetical protein